MRQHLKERKVTFDLYPTANIDDVERVWTLYLYNLAGQVQGFHTYRPDQNKEKRNDPKLGRYYTYLPADKLAPWGLETYHFRSDVLCLTEGIFDSVRLHNYGLPSIALLSNDPKKYRQWLRLLPRYNIAFCDADENGSGAKMAKIGDGYVTCPASKDLGDMDEEDLYAMLRRINLVT